MSKYSKADLLPKVKKLFCDDYTVIYATEDGLFFSDSELAKEHAKKIGSVVFTFKEEDLKNLSVTTQPAADLTAQEAADKAAQEAADKAAADKKKE